MPGDRPSVQGDVVAFGIPPPPTQHYSFLRPVAFVGPWSLVSVLLEKDGGTTNTSSGPPLPKGHGKGALCLNTVLPNSSTPTPSPFENSLGAQTAGKLASRSDCDGSLPCRKRKYVLFIQFCLFPPTRRSYGDGNTKGIIFRAQHRHKHHRYHRGVTMNQRAACLQMSQGWNSRRQRQPPANATQTNITTRDNR